MTNSEEMIKSVKLFLDLHVLHQFCFKDTITRGGRILNILNINRIQIVSIEY